MYLLSIYIIIIFLLSSTPPNIVQSIQINGLDKVIHLIEYLLLGIVYKATKSNLLIRYYLLIFIIPIIDEFIIQKYSGRNVDIFDFIADIIGLMIGIIIYRYILEKHKNL